MNTEYSKVVNFEPEIEEEDVAIEEVTVPVTEHTFEVCDGFAVESLAALLPKSDKNIVELVLNSVYKQVESIDNLEALESYSAKFESIRNFFNAPVKNIKEISTTMEAGTEAYAAAMESELTQVAFIKNMLGIGEKESCSISDVRDCSDSLKKIGTLIESRRAALESIGDCGKKDVATEGKKDSEDNPPKEGIEDDRVMKPVDDDILTKKEFALAISMAQYFQNREEKGEKVPKLGKGVTWKDVVLGIHKGHYTVNALCDLGGGNIFCKGKDGKLAAVEGSDAKEMYMRAGKGIDGKNVFIVDSDDDLDENGKAKSSAVTKAYKIAKGTESVEETPGYIEVEATSGEEEFVLDSEEEEDDDIESIAEYLAAEAEESLGFFSDEEIEELNVALEAMLLNDYTPEEFISYIAEEGVSDRVKEVADKIATKRYARKNKVSLNMAKVDRAFKALEKSLKSFEQPLNSGKYNIIKKCFNIILAIGGTAMVGVLGASVFKEIDKTIEDLSDTLADTESKLVATSGELEKTSSDLSEVNSRLDKNIAEKEKSAKFWKMEVVDKSNEFQFAADQYQKRKNEISEGKYNENSIKVPKREYETAKSELDRVEKHYRLAQAELEEAKKLKEGANESFTNDHHIGVIAYEAISMSNVINLLKKGGFAAICTIGVGVTGNMIINKLQNKTKENESIIRNTVDAYQDEYKKAKELFDKISIVYSKIKKNGDPIDIDLVNDFITTCKETTNIIANSYKSLVKMMKQLVKSAKKNKTSITEESRIQKKAKEKESAKEGLEISDNDFESEVIDDNNLDITALETLMDRLDDHSIIRDNVGPYNINLLTDLSDDELFELETILESFVELDMSEEDIEEYLATEGITDGVKSAAKKIGNWTYAKTHGVSIKRAMIDKAFRNLTRAYKAYEHPLKTPNIIIINRCLKAALIIGGIVAAGTIVGELPAPAFMVASKAAKGFSKGSWTSSKPSINSAEDAKAAAKVAAGAAKAVAKPSADTVTYTDLRNEYAKFKKLVDEASTGNDQIKKNELSELKSALKSFTGLLAEYESNSNVNVKTKAQMTQTISQATNLMKHAASESFLLENDEDDIATEAKIKEVVADKLDSLKEAAASSKEAGGFTSGKLLLGISATVAALGIAKKITTNKSDEEYVKNNIEEYQESYQRATELYNEAKEVYEDLIKKPEPYSEKDVSEFDKYVKELISVISNEYSHSHGNSRAKTVKTISEVDRI